MMLKRLSRIARQDNIIGWQNAILFFMNKRRLQKRFFIF